tara:strand:+ start:194 stop:1786 length:1593 start_codon:yes stop_codon:yes gene_type:complete
LKSKLIYLITILLFLSIIKTDYRLESDIRCCKDDHDYFAHAETIAEDFDFNYDNQFDERPNQRFRNLNNDKQAPIGFLGSGLLASPFILLGNVLNRLIPHSDIFNFKIMFYSLSSIFYLFFTCKIFIRIKKLLNLNIKNYLIYLVFFGSGVSYYALERYSMPHVYEVFTATLIIFNTTLIMLNKENKKYYFLLPFTILLGLLVKWVHIYFIFLPYLVKELLHITKGFNKVRIYSNKFFLSSSTLAISIFLFLSKQIYGEVILNPETIYRANGFVENSIFGQTSFFDLLYESLKNFIVILFSEEFGLFWFNPVILLGILSVIYLIIKYPSSKNWALYFVATFSYIQIFGIVLLWKSAASAYGYRYIMNLIPFSLFLILMVFDLNKSKLLNKYLLFFSIFGLISVILFEGNTGTQLSVIPIENSFGRVLVYTQPNYLTGLLKSFFDIEVYLKIFTTSFLGLIFFKTLLILGIYDLFINFLSALNLPINNPDLINYISKIQSISLLQVLMFVFICFVFVRSLIRDFNKDSLPS